MLLQWQKIVEKSAADCFVNRVVAPDILARNFQFALHVENSGGMKSAGPHEITLRVAQFFRQGKQRLNIDPDFCGRYRRKILPDRVKACLAAQTTTAGNCSKTLRRAEFHFYAVCKIDDDSVIASR